MLGRIAIHLSDDAACARRIDAGILLAGTHGAEVVGLYPNTGIASLVHDEDILPTEVRKVLRSRQEEHRESVRQSFMDQARAAGVQADWRTPVGEAETVLAMHARYCDLIIMSKAEPAEGVTAFLPNLPESVVMAAGRPVLMIPNYGTFETIGKRILYCWDQRREAARAFIDAGPFLKTCERLAILEIDRDEALLKQRDLRPDDFLHYCTSLGYPKPRHLLRESLDIGVGHVILNTASDTDSDLIVMGAYGHSRMRQWIMGGASRTLLSSMTVPVLLAN